MFSSLTSFFVTPFYLCCFGSKISEVNRSQKLGARLHNARLWDLGCLNFAVLLTVEVLVA